MCSGWTPWAFLSVETTPLDPQVVDLLIARRLRPGIESHGLTGRELDVLHHMALGKTNAAIATELFLSESAIEKHINAIFTKLGCGRRPSCTVA